MRIATQFIVQLYILYGDHDVFSLPFAVMFITHEFAKIVYI